MSQTRARIKIAFDMSSSAQALDVLTGTNPDFWRGEDVEFHIAVKYGADFVNISNWASIVLQVKSATDKTGAPLMAAEQLNAAFENDVITKAEWDDNTKANLIVPFTNVETNLDLAGADSKQFWLVLGAITDTGKRITVGTAQLVIREDGWTGELEPTATDGVRIYLGKLQLRDASTGLWHTISVSNQPEGIILGVEQIGVP